MGVEHILTEILNRPLLITPDKLNVFLGVLNRKTDNPINIDLTDLVPAIGSDREGGAMKAEARPVNQTGKRTIAVVSALGSLVHRNHGFDNGSGLRSYRYLQNDIQAGLDDPEVVGMILDFDTYGGVHAGCERLARFIRQADAIKPIYAVVDLSCFSAGYYNAAACRKVLLTDRTAGVGSIGCIAIHRDQSLKNEMDGITYTAVYFGSEKNDFSPHEPLSADLRRKLQTSVDQAGMQFAKTVAEFRGLDLKAILAMNAGVFYGEEAIEAGLADGIASFDEAAAMLTADIKEQQSTTFYGGFSMTTKDRMEKLLTADDGPAALAELGYVKAEETAAKVAESAESAKKELLNVAELCQLGGLTIDQSVSLLKSSPTAADARETIQRMRAEKSQKTVVKSTITQLSGDGKHPLIASCEQLTK